MTKAKGLKLLRAEFKRIKKNPANWEQDCWVNSCGPAFCLAGGAAVHNGLAKIGDNDGIACLFDKENQPLMAFSQFAKLFGFELDEGHLLFNSDNSLDDIESVLNRLEKTL